MKKKGQALVEFVIILPIFLMLILGMVDIGQILYNKISLEEKMSDIIALYNSGKNTQEIASSLDLKTDNIVLNIKEATDITDFDLTKELSIITPGLNLLFSDPYKLEINRSIKNEAK